MLADIMLTIYLSFIGAGLVPVAGFVVPVNIFDACKERCGLSTISVLVFLEGFIVTVIMLFEWMVRYIWTHPA